MKMGWCKTFGWAGAVFVAMLLVAGSAMAGGISLLEFSAKGLGTSFAGGAAYAEEASTVFFNPAGLTRLKAPEAQANLHAIFIQADFKDQGSTNVGGTSLTGSNDDGGTEVFVPSLFASMPVSDRLVFGLGVHSPYGLATDYDDDWVGRYHATSSDLITVNINPSVGVKVMDWLSLGFGLSAQYIDADLQNEVDFGLAAGSAAEDLGAPAGTAVGLSQSFDGSAKITGDDWGFGFNVGVLLEPTDSTRFGIHYRSQIKHSLEGEADFDSVPTAAELSPVLGPQLGTGIANGLAATFNDPDVESDITLPATLSFSAYHAFNDQWAILADVTWTDYSQMDELRIEFDNTLEDSVTTLDWDDTWRYSLGLNYKPTPNLVLRCGAAYDESPVPNKEARTPRVPDDDRFWLSAGLGYTWFERLTVDIGYAHLFIGDTGINKSTNDPENQSRGNVVGEFDAAADIVGLEVRYVF